MQLQFKFHTGKRWTNLFWYGSDYHMIHSYRLHVIIQYILAKYFKYDLFMYTDFDECGNETDDCDSNANCDNTYGGYNCTCYDGYEGDGLVGDCNGEYFCILHG